MSETNVVVLVGRVVGHPRQREMPGGNTLEVFTVQADGATVICVADTLPVWVTDQAPVEITGRISTRYYRVGGATQSRTEVFVRSIT